MGYDAMTDQVVKFVSKVKIKKITDKPITGYRLQITVFVVLPSNYGNDKDSFHSVNFIFTLHFRKLDQGSEIIFSISII